MCFNTQPPEGGCLVGRTKANVGHWVSTHSRPKAAAGRADVTLDGTLSQFQHTAARRRLRIVGYLLIINIGGFNTQPPEGGCDCSH